MKKKEGSNFACDWIKTRETPTNRQRERVNVMRTKRFSVNGKCDERAAWLFFQTKTNLKKGEAEGEGIKTSVLRAEDDPEDGGGG